MDGFKKRLSASVRLKLALALGLAIALVALAAGALSFAVAYREAQALQDDVLRQVAGLIRAQALTPALAVPDTRWQERDDETRLIVQRLGAPNPAGRDVDHGGTLPVPAALADGLHSLRLGGEAFRVLIATGRDGVRFVVAQEAGLRDELAGHGALRTLLPFAVLAPVLLLVVLGLVRQSFRPIAELADEIDRRDDRDLHPIATDRVPSEVRPFIVALNRLLARVGQAMEGQRRFIADAAHELRSPLTALSLQAERLQDAPMSDTARERLAALRAGMERARHLLGQLLALARAQSAAGGVPAATSVQAGFRRVLEDLLPLAEAGRIDIGVQGAQEDACVALSGLDLHTLLRNLVDNAIRHTPEGGRIDLAVRATADGALLTVRDSGPGIARAERERVFDPFYRSADDSGTGSGLGLAIVQAIVRRTGARIALDAADPASGRGLCVALTLPLAPTGG